VRHGFCILRHGDVSVPTTFERWLAALEARHLANLRFAELTRALRALSSTYVERRDRLESRGGFDTAGKRAAYAVYYSPLHFLTVDRIVDALRAFTIPRGTLLDLGCGTGAAGAAWASRIAPSPRVLGIDSHPWAVGETVLTYRTFGLDAGTRRADARRATIPRSATAIIAGWMLNEVDDRTRLLLQGKLLQAASHGAALLIVEPIATRVSPWWSDWARAVDRIRGRADEWRFPVELPELLKRLDRAAGMRHDELKARSLYVPPTRERGSHRERQRAALP